MALITDKVIVRPTYLSICAADQRYYMGLRAKKYLKTKLPMALIHEATGQVVHAGTSKFKEGDSVVLIPNTPVVSDQYIAENYLASSKFRASGFDGFMQEYVEMDSDRLVLCNGVHPIVASVCELMSVAMHSVTTFLNESHGRRDVVGIWGDGNLAYMTALILHYMSKNTKIVITGIDPYKMGFFSFADRTLLFDDMPEDLVIDHAFECVGGQGSESAINQIIDHINPEGTIMLMGVSERNVAISTRMVLEKGLRLIGRSRSGREDFVNTIELLKNCAEFEEQASKILSNVVTVSSVREISEIFEQDIKSPFKSIMKWNV